MRKDYRLAKRRYVIGGFICLIVVIYIFRLFNLQVSEDKYKENADSNAFLRRVIYPARGLVYDREDRLVVFNQPAYDVMIIPKDVGEFDTLTLCNVLNLTKDQLMEKWMDMKNPKKKSGLFFIYSTKIDISFVSVRLWKTTGKVISISWVLYSNQDCKTIQLFCSSKCFGKYQRGISIRCRI